MLKYFSSSLKIKRGSRFAFKPKLKLKLSLEVGGGGKTSVRHSNDKNSFKRKSQDSPPYALKRDGDFKKVNLVRIFKKKTTLTLGNNP